MFIGLGRQKLAVRQSGQAAVAAAPPPPITAVSPPEIQAVVSACRGPGGRRKKCLL